MNSSTGSTTDKTAELATAVTDLHRLMVQAASTPERATPCQNFDIDELLNHLAVWSVMFAAAAEGEAPTIDPSTERFEPGAAVDAFVRSTRRLVDALEREGVDRAMMLGADPIPGPVLVDMMIMEYVAHGWDLARSLGVEPPTTHDAAASTLALARTMVQPEHRSPEMFGPEHPSADDAPAIDRLAAFLGRDPEWTRP